MEAGATGTQGLWVRMGGGGCAREAGMHGGRCKGGLGPVGAHGRGQVCRGMVEGSVDIPGRGQVRTGQLCTGDRCTGRCTPGAGKHRSGGQVRTNGGSSVHGTALGVPADLGLAAP